MRWTTLLGKVHRPKGRHQGRHCKHPTSLGRQVERNSSIPRISRNLPDCRHPEAPRGSQGAFVQSYSSQIDCQVIINRKRNIIFIASL